MKVQGDLFFIKVEKIPENARRINPEGNRYVLARRKESWKDMVDFMLWKGIQRLMMLHSS